jgi:hypothetical protein
MVDAMDDRSPWHDPIVAEVRAARAALFAAAGRDIQEYCRRARENQQRSGHPIILGGAGPTDSTDTTTAPPEQAG